jgi:hypothetical protein
LRCSIRGRVDEANAVAGLDRFGEFVVAQAQVLDEGVATDRHRRRLVVFDPAYGP